MKLGKESRYAIEGLMILAQHPSGIPMQVRDIAVEARTPPDFLAKIFQKLKRANILVSSRGAVRGYALAHRASAITLADIFTAVEGGDVFEHCVFWSDRCADRSPCPVHWEWKKMRQSIVGSMRKITLADLIRREKRTGSTDRKAARDFGGISE